jgi:hypothetical protein
MHSPGKYLDVQFSTDLSTITSCLSDRYRLPPLFLSLSVERISVFSGMAMRNSSAWLEGAMAEADRLMYEMKTELRTRYPSGCS